VGSYVGGDIIGGILASGMHKKPEVALFVDIGTNGKMVLGGRKWLTEIFIIKNNPNPIKNINARHVILCYLFLVPALVQISIITGIVPCCFPRRPAGQQAGNSAPPGTQIG
jgi:hypothetical protein